VGEPVNKVQGQYELDMNSVHIYLLIHNLGQPEPKGVVNEVFLLYNFLSRGNMNKIRRKKETKKLQEARRIVQTGI
jgi:hypothetical protein